MATKCRKFAFSAYVLVRLAVPGFAGDAKAPQDFGRSWGADFANHIKYWHPQIFRPSYGPGQWFYPWGRQDFNRSVYPISTKWADYAHEIMLAPF